MRAVYYIILCTGKLINLRPGFFFVCVNIKEGGCDCRLEVNRLAKHLSLAWISEIYIVFFTSSGLCSRYKRATRSPYHLLLRNIMQSNYFIFFSIVTLELHFYHLNKVSINITTILRESHKMASKTQFLSRLNCFSHVR